MDNEKIPELNDKDLSSVEKMNAHATNEMGKKRSNLKGRWRRANGRTYANNGAIDESKPGMIPGDSDAFEDKNDHHEAKCFIGNSDVTPVSLNHNTKRSLGEPVSRLKGEKEFSHLYRNQASEATGTTCECTDKACFACRGIKAFFRKIVGFFRGKKSDLSCNVQDKDTEKKGYDRPRRHPRNFQKYNKKPFRRNHSDHRRPQQ